MLHGIVLFHGVLRESSKTDITRASAKASNNKYVVISHSVAYTAQGVAALTHISGKALAKTVFAKIDGALALALLPAGGVSLSPAATQACPWSRSRPEMSRAARQQPGELATAGNHWR